MTDRTETGHALERYTAAYDREDPGLAPLAPDVTYSGPMVPETLRGEQAVRGHIGDIAPFMREIALRRIVIDGAEAAAVFEVTGINGAVIHGAQFFRCENGLIRDIQVYFDTAPLRRGGDQ